MTTLPDIFSRSPILLLAPLIAAGCGGGGGSQQAGPPGAPVPDAVVQFPPAFVQTDAETITVRGRALHPQRIASIRVHGVPALSQDGFATWTAEVQLEAGMTELDVDLHTVDGQLLEDVDAVTVRRDPVTLGEPLGMAFSAAGALGPCAWYIDQERLVRQVLSTEEVDLISSPDRGQGPEFGELKAIAVDSGGSTVFVIDKENGDERLLSIEVHTGNRSVVINPDPAPDPNDELGNSSDMSTLTFGILEYLIVSDQSRAGYMVIDTVTGARQFQDTPAGPFSGADKMSLWGLPQGADLHFAFLDGNTVYWAPPNQAPFAVAGPGIGQGPIWSDASDLTFLSDGDILVSDRYGNEAYLIDMQGPFYQRARLSEVHGLGGITFQAIQAIDTLTINGIDFISVLDTGLDISAIIDWDSQEWVPLHDTRVGGGAPMNNPIDMVPVETGFLVSSVYPGGLIHVDQGTGDRYSAADWGQFSMEHMPFSVCVDEAAGQAYMFEAFTMTIYAADLATGILVPVSSPHLGNGFELDELIFDLELVPGEEALLALSESWLVRVDLTTGDRVLVSGEGIGAGEPFDSAICMALDPNGGNAFVSSDERILTVDLMTGDRSTVSGPNTGAGPFLPDTSSGLYYSATRQELLALADEGSQIYRIDANSGDRELVTSQNDAGRAVDKGLRLHWDQATETVFTLDLFRGALYAFDLEQGQWVILSR